MGKYCDVIIYAGHEKNNLGRNETNQEVISNKHQNEISTDSERLFVVSIT